MKFIREIVTAVIIFVLLSILTGLIYPLTITGVVQTFIPGKANGSLLTMDGKIVGSDLIGQNFTRPGYFHGRPSAIDYRANSSGASNLGPSSRRLIEKVQNEVERVKIENNLAADSLVPADLVMASASGLDPHISVDSARLQANRIAESRGIEPIEVIKLIDQHIEPMELGIFGQPRINVIRLNIALDNLNKSR